MGKSLFSKYKFLLILMCAFMCIGVINQNVKGNEKTKVIDADAEYVLVNVINDDKIIDKIELIKGQDLSNLKTPKANENQTYFIGWFQDKELTKAYDITEKVNTSMNIYAKFSDSYLLSFKDYNNTIIYTEQVKKGRNGSDKKLDINAPSGYSFRYWYNELDSEKQSYDFNEKLNEDITLKPVTSNKILVRFITKGSRVDNISLNKGDSITSNPTTQRRGYKFLYWSEKQNGSEFDLNQKIEKEIVLYAVFEPATTSYTVSIWLEKANISGDPGTDLENYTNKLSVNKTGVTESKVEIDKKTADSLINSSSTDKDFMIYSNYASSEEKELASDGTTKINVFYKRIYYNFIFDFKNLIKSYEVNNKVIEANENYSFKAKYQQNVKDIIPKNIVTRNSNELFSGWQTSSNTQYGGTLQIAKRDIITYLMISLDKNNLDVYNYAYTVSNGVAYTRSAYLECLECSDQSKVYNRKKYDLYETLNYNFTNGVSWTQWTIKGYTFENMVTDIYNSKEMKTSSYYKLNKYQLLFETNEGKFLTEDPSKVKTYTEKIDRPNDPVKENYDFAGWYFDSNFKNKVDFTDLRMPADYTILYAKWIPINKVDYNVEYLDKFNGKEITPKQKYDRENITYLNTPKEFKENETFIENKGLFLGWFTRVDKSDYQVNNETLVNSDMVLFAKWKTNDFEITYNVNNGEGILPIDGNKYYMNTQAIVKRGESLIGPNQSIFYAWKNDEGNLYYPYSTIIIDNDQILTAQYAQPNMLTTIKYFENKPNTYADTVINIKVLKNSKVKLAGLIFNDNDYELVGWTTNKESSKVEYELNYNDFEVKEDTVELYGVWKHKDLALEFKAKENGHLDFKDDNYIQKFAYNHEWDKNDEEKVPTPIADMGYEFVGWTPQLPNVEDKLIQNQVYQANFELIKEGEFIVKYVDEFNNKIHEDSDKIIYNFKEHYDLLDKKIVIDEYDFVESDKPLTGITDKEENVITLKYKKNVSVIHLSFKDMNNNNIKDSIDVKVSRNGYYDLTSYDTIEGYKFVKSDKKLQGSTDNPDEYITLFFEKNKEIINDKDDDKTKGEIIVNKNHVSKNRNDLAKTNDKNSKTLSTKLIHDNMIPKTGTYMIVIISLLGVLGIITFKIKSIL